MEIEKGTSDQSFLSGYPSLAAFIASDRDQTTTIFKRSNRLAAQYSRNWAEFKRAADNDSRHKGRKELGDEIVQTLKAYLNQLVLLPRLPKRTLEAFCFKFFNCESEKPSPTLCAHIRELFYDRDDLVVLKIQDHDRLTAVFRVEKDRDGIVYSSDQRTARTVTDMCALNAAALVVGAIKTKLGVIAIFTAFFAANSGILTNSRRSEVFAATAACAVMLVVFVSGNIGT
ncbi:hypothetical protein COCC4DRAFT_125699 [Bipolaris maydis ATCC 48331]|uniref:DUF6594 domain-containing protein n=2 Tax=Cochliobolus heterostrophus TaxID=5016 RepID=M2UQ99_COCH5|nr:uncharacterized protein COCC4DRAFT_125699 [Bipolaris maydis ATCC 48331]EMD90118.1 hypothetical protein COCHEDRAFT_1157142 [Bipolaris maydis C5]ENI09668.1 hypothetical protein COCC4DRAFT_125699 [Bipolaris maydis ATCC 48331]KAJ6207940.1 hypothetical protein PSV09DRAFT_1157142 [Bipolaris maydis]